MDIGLVTSNKIVVKTDSEYESTIGRLCLLHQAFGTAPKI